MRVLVCLCAGTLAASLVTAEFNRRVLLVCIEKGLDVSDLQLPIFDCRLGVFDTKDEAMALVYWRAHDCGINGVSDAVYHLAKGERVRTSLSQAKLDVVQLLNFQCLFSIHITRVYLMTAKSDTSQSKVVALHRTAKMQWLHEHGHLPLPLHQACGSFYVRVRRLGEGYNPKTKAKTTTCRWTVELNAGHVLRHLREGSLFPANEDLPADGAVASPDAEETAVASAAVPGTGMAEQMEVEGFFRAMLDGSSCSSRGAAEASSN